MEELNQIAGERFCREDSLFPTLLGTALATVIAFVLALCLGYL